jgi:hypothetical protein
MKPEMFGGGRTLNWDDVKVRVPSIGNLPQEILVPYTLT